MKIFRFYVFLGAIFLVSVGVYLYSTPRGSEIPLTGIITGNEVLVSPQTSGRMVRLLVDEGSEVKKGQLIAELDAAALQAARDSAAANVRALEARVASARNTWNWTNASTDATVRQTEAALTAIAAQLEQARANLWRDQQTYQRTQGLFEANVASAQDRDLAEAALRASEAAVKSLEEQVKVQEAQRSVAEANRKQLDVQQSDLAVTQAQLQQARAEVTQAETQLGYTKIYSPLDGIVSVRAARQGEMVGLGAPIVTIIDVDHLWVQTGVEESLVNSIQFGQTLRIRLPSGDEIEGKVFFKGVESEFATQRDVSRTKRDIKTFSIKLSIPNPGRRLFAGMTATVLLPPPPAEKSWWQRLTGAVLAPAFVWGRAKA
jgi:multidrug resistance efflux pump